MAMQLLGNGTDLGGTGSEGKPKEPEKPSTHLSKDGMDVDPATTLPKKRTHSEIHEEEPKETVEDVLEAVKKQKLETGIDSLFF